MAAVLTKDEYGLDKLGELPILEQLHRLMHAILKGYPYKETKGWRSLTLDQKRKLLDCIQSKRLDAAHPSLVVASNDLNKSEVDSEAIVTQDNESASSEAVSDPYLMMLRKKHSECIKESECNATPIDGTEIEFDEVIYTRQVQRRKANARWTIEEEQYRTQTCPCGKKHSFTGKGNSDDYLKSIQITTATMMSTFGDAPEPCLTSVDRVQCIVNAFIRHQLRSYEVDGLIKVPSLTALVEAFPEEAVYYGRWREFRADAKQEETELEAIEEEELADELDLFAVPQDNCVFTEAFMERIRFADVRTKNMEWSQYSLFSHDRKQSYLHKKGASLLKWLKLQHCSRASMEFINFVAYHNVGKIVEQAIKKKTKGTLDAQTKPLLLEDIDAVIDQCMGSRDATEPSAPEVKSKKRQHDNGCEFGSSEATCTHEDPKQNTIGSASTSIHAQTSPNVRPGRLKRLR